MIKSIFIITRVEKVGHSNGFNGFVQGGIIRNDTRVEPIAYDNKLKAHEQCVKLVEKFKIILSDTNAELCDWHVGRGNYYIIYCIGNSELHRIDFYIEELLLEEEVV